MGESIEREGPRDKQTDRQTEGNRERVGIGEKEADRGKCERGIVRERDRGSQNVK